MSWREVRNNDIITRRDADVATASAAGCVSLWLANSWRSDGLSWLNIFIRPRTETGCNKTVKSAAAAAAAA